MGQSGQSRTVPLHDAHFQYLRVRRWHVGETGVNQLIQWCHPNFSGISLEMKNGDLARPKS